MHEDRADSASGPGASEPVRVNATVLEALPNALYRVELETAARPRVTAHAAPGLLRIRPGDGVVVEIAAWDAGRARIVRRRG